jgi:hypothetical protein
LFLPLFVGPIGADAAFDFAALLIVSQPSW